MWKLHGHAKGWLARAWTQSCREGRFVYVQGEDGQPRKGSTVRSLDLPIPVARSDRFALGLVDAESRQVTEGNSRLEWLDVLVSILLRHESHNFGKAVAVLFVEAVFESFDPGPREHEKEEDETESEGEPGAVRDLLERRTPEEAVEEAEEDKNDDGGNPVETFDLNDCGSEHNCRDDEDTRDGETAER